MEKLKKDTLIEEELTEDEEAYLTQILDEAIESFRKNPVTIPYEVWQTEMREKYNVNF